MTGKMRAQIMMGALAALCVMVIVLLVGFFTLNAKVKTLSESLKLARQEANGYYGDLISNILAINEQVGEQASLISDYQHEYQDLDVDAGTATLSLSFVVKQKQAGTDIYVLYSRDDDSENFTEVKATTESGGRFAATVPIVTDHNFLVRIVERGEDGYEMTLTTQDIFCDVVGELGQGSVSVDLQNGYEDEDGTLAYDYYFMNRSHQTDDLLVTRVEFALLYGEEVVYREELETPEADEFGVQEATFSLRVPPGEIPVEAGEGGSVYSALEPVFYVTINGEVKELRSAVG
jgi:uncharacterized protein YerC